MRDFKAGDSILTVGLMHIPFKLTYDYFSLSIAWHVLLNAALLFVYETWILNRNKRYTKYIF